MYYLLAVSYTHLRAHETEADVVCRLLLEKKKFTIIDARSRERFNGSVPDPRKNVRSGSIPNSVCLPFKEIINSSDNTFKGVSEISKKFSEIIDLNDDKRVFSCGSGITACVLGLAYSLVNNTYSPTVYDGSWAEYGLSLIHI